MVVSFKQSTAAWSACAGVFFCFWLQAGVSQAADVTVADEVIVPATSPSPSRFGRVSERLADWEVVIGGGAMVEPEYEGSDKFKVSPVPYVSATFNDWLKVDPSGVEATVYSTDHLQFSGLLGYNGGRDEDDSDVLRGMGDVDAGASVGGRASFAFGPASLFVQGEKTIGGDEGFVGVAGVEVEHAVSKGLILSAGASATFADENHMQSYFGVDAQQAARSGHDRYDPGAGIKRVDFTVAATSAINENWFVRGEAGVGVLVGDAKDSPLVKDEIQPSGLLMLGYRF